MAGKNTSKAIPFDLGAAYAAKLSADDGMVRFTVGDAEFGMRSAAYWTEAELDLTNRQTPFEILRKALGDDEYARLIDVVEGNDLETHEPVAATGQTFDLHMAKALLQHYLKSSGLASLGE